METKETTMRLFTRQPAKPATLSELQRAWYEVYAIARAQREAGAK